MTPQEMDVLILLADAWNAFVKLPDIDIKIPGENCVNADRNEFCLAIHAAQNIVLARVGQQLLRQKEIERRYRP